MPQQHRNSWHSFHFNISYQLTREYPFQNFKWIVVGLMTVLFGFFSLFNLATLGYDLQPTTSMDPNATAEQHRWFNNNFFTWGDDSLTSKCQDIEIGVGTSFLTSNQGSVFTVTGIAGPCDSLNTSRNMQCPSVSYHYGILSNCRINRVQVLFRKTDQSKRGVNSHWYSWGTSTAAAQAQCDISNDKGIYTISFETQYSGLSKVFDFLAVDDFNRSSSLWWGSRLMDNYFNGMQAVTATSSTNSTTNWEEFSTGQINFDVVNTTGPIHGSSIFNAYFYFYQLNGGILNPESTGHKHDQRIFNNLTFEISRSLTEALFFAKAFYSQLLTDLGNTRSPNLLLDEPSLRYALNPSDNFNRLPAGPLYYNNTTTNTTNLDWWRASGMTPYNQYPTIGNSIPMAEAYDRIPPSPNPLGTRPATIYFQYACSVPVRKGTTTILLLILVNDFVLLQVAWALVTFVADRVVSAKDPTAMFCDGCRRDRKRNSSGADADQVALLPVKSRGMENGLSSSPDLPMSMAVSVLEERRHNKTWPVVGND